MTWGRVRYPWGTRRRMIRPTAARALGRRCGGGRPSVDVLDEPVEHARLAPVVDVDTLRAQPLGVCVTLVAKRVELGGHDERGRQIVQALCKERARGAARADGGVGYPFGGVAAQVGHLEPEPGPELRDARLCEVRSVFGPTSSWA